MAVPTTTVRIDWDNDGAFSQSIDDVSAKLHEADWTRGRNADFSGDATGAATLRLWNADDRFTPERNWHDNPSFEAGTTGWSTAAIASLTAAATSITQVTDNAPSAGTRAGEAVLTATLNSGVTYSIPYRFRSGVAHSVSVYLKSMSGNLNVRAGLASSGTPADIASSGANITTSWAQYTFTWTPTGDRTDAVFFVRTTTAAVATVRIDAVQVNAGTTANTYLEAPTRGQLVPGRPVHAYGTYSAVDYPQFFGYIQRITPDAAAKTVTVTCYDVLQRMDETDVVVPANTFIQRSARDMRVEVLSDYERGTRNLCHNPSFETNTTGWTIDGGGTLTRIATDAASGSACGEYAATAINQRLEFKLRQTPVFFAGQTYRLSLYLRTTSGTANWEIGLYTDVVSQIASKTVSVNTTWTRHTIAFTLPATVSANDDAGTPQRLTVMLRSTGANTVRVDAVAVTRGQGLHPYADTGSGRWPNWCGNGSFDGGARNGWYDGWTNLVGNPSFETDATGWAVTASSFHGAANTITRSTVQAHIGTASGLVDVTGGSQGCHYAITGTFVSGVTYHLRLALRLATAGGASFTVGIGSDGTPTDKGETTTGTVDDTAWTTWTATWTPTANRTDAQVYVSNPGTTDFYVDAVQVVRRDPDTTNAPLFSNTGPGGGGSFTSNRVITTTQAKYGSRSHSCDTPATATAGRVYDFNHFGSYFVSGQAYTASVWLRPTSNMPYRVGIGGNKGDGTWDEASVTGTATANTWTQVTVTWTPSADRSSLNPFDAVLFVYQTDITARTFYLDGVRVIPGSSADDFEMTHWSLPTTGEATDVYLTSASFSGSAQAALADLNDLTLTRHYIKPAMASPFYTYVAADRDTLSTKASAETFDSEATQGFVFSQVDIDRSAIVNVVPVAYAGRTEYYSDSESVNKYGARPTGGIAGGSYFPDATVPDVVGPALVARYKDPRPRPVLTVENRFPSQLQRELDDLITVKNDRTRTYNARYLIVRVTTRVTQAGNRWTTTYQLEEHAY